MFAVVSGAEWCHRWGGEGGCACVRGTGAGAGAGVGAGDGGDGVLGAGTFAVHCRAKKDTQTRNYVL